MITASDKAAAARSRRLRRHRITCAAAVLALSAATLSACSDDGDAGGAGDEIVITCAACQDSPTDPFLKYHHEAVQRFNEKYAGKYRVEILQNQYASDSPDRLQYYQRLALADDLPDVFLLGSTEIETLKQTGKLLNFAPILDSDSAWKDSFHDGVFDSLKGEGDEVWAIPEQRASIGVYYNKAILREAGISKFPQTWDELEADCEKIKEQDNICLAMDGDWATLMMWANLIGTQTGGRAFLTDGIREGDYAGNPLVVKATETLKQWHADGYVNRDAFSGDYEDAAAPFVSGHAAFIGNGPWMVGTDIKTKDAAKGLYDQVGYEPSPGWTADQRGMIVSSGAGWLSGATDDRKQAAVVAWMRFVTSRPEALEQLRKTNSYPPVKVEFTAAETKSQEPLAAGLVKAAGEVPLTYPHAYTRAPSGFGAAWMNLWPAYAKNEMDTTEFLERLEEDSATPTG